MQIGDIVTRKSYNHDINFFVEGISNHNVTLSAIHYRLSADALESDLKLIEDRGVSNNIQTAETSPPPPLEESRGIINSLFGGHKEDDFYCAGRPENIPSSIAGKHFPKILHIDANSHYLSQSLAQYEKYDLPVLGFNILENVQPYYILGLLMKFHPNILVITGHDSISKNKNDVKTIDDYLNSKYFVESVRIAREFNRNYDDLIIVAGGCKSYYEALMGAGANYASSPNRVLINITDPVTIASKLATTSIKDVIGMDDIATDISSGCEGFGGIETRGQCRNIKPIF